MTFMLMWGIKYGNKDNIRQKVTGGKEIKIRYWKSLKRKE